GTAQSFDEVFGYPHNQLTTHYWFPWYDMVNMTTWVLVGNPSPSQTAHVTIKIAGVTRGTYDIAPNGRVTPVYPGLVDGPVEVLSDIPVFTSERSLWPNAGYLSTFNEVMGYPDNRLTTTYRFPWYDMVNMTTWVLVGNPSSSQAAHVTIKIAGATVGTYSVPASGRVTPTYAGQNTGPVEVSSDIPVFTSERVLSTGPGSVVSFNEMMGLAQNQMTTKYWFTWYDNLNMLTDILIANP
ncbi:MAG TPA: hypothetical protein VIU38_04065, partial [Anaerolineales bacterium]